MRIRFQIMKIIAISDTHGYHSMLKLPPGDMIIHAGDVSGRGTKAEVVRFLDWFSVLEFKHKIFIAGNHDFFFENGGTDEIDEIIPEGVTYLNDSGIEIDGIKIWGSPVQPWFLNWAFNRQRGAQIKERWDLMPADTDILITHGPPHGILDATAQGELVGCEDLLQKVSEVKPRFHVFGHIHEAYGRKQLNGTEFINASVLNRQYYLVHEPVVIELYG